jgi:hypothetical protein
VNRQLLGAGFIYVEFEEQDAAIKCRTALTGRSFSGQSVLVHYYPVCPTPVATYQAQSSARPATPRRAATDHSGGQEDRFAKGEFVDITTDHLAAAKTGTATGLPAANVAAPIILGYTGGMGAPPIPPESLPANAGPWRSEPARAAPATGFSNAPAVAGPASPPAGRGRDNTLPAWMTAQQQ